MGGFLVNFGLGTAGGALLFAICVEHPALRAPVLGGAALLGVVCGVSLLLDLRKTYTPPK